MKAAKQPSLPQRLQGCLNLSMSAFLEALLLAISLAALQAGSLSGRPAGNPAAKHPRRLAGKQRSRLLILQSCKQACRQRSKENGLSDFKQSSDSGTMIVAFANQKGGVGKSTLAVHFAAWHAFKGIKTALVDVDAQATSSRWIQVAEPQVTLARVSAGVKADDIADAVELLSTDHEMIVLDGPGSMSDPTRVIFMISDLVVLPCGPSFADLETTADGIRTVLNCRKWRGDTEGKPLAVIALNRLGQERYNNTRESREAAEKFGVPVCKSVVRYRDPIADAVGQRSVVWKMGYKARDAAKEMVELITEVTTYGEKNEHGRAVQRGAAGIHRGEGSRHSRIAGGTIHGVERASDFREGSSPVERPAVVNS